MGRVPNTTVSFQLAQIALAQPLRVLAIAPRGTGFDPGDVAVNVPRKVLSEADAVKLWGLSQGVDAARRFFSLGLQKAYELWGVAVSSSGWTANTWDITVSADPATEAGTETFRFADVALTYAVAKSDDTADIAASLVAAITASTRVRCSAAVSTPAVSSFLDLGAETTNLDTVIAAQKAGTQGDDITIQTVADGTGVGSLDESAFPALVFHFEAGVTTVTNFETAVAGSAYIEVQTPGTGANVLASPADVIAATNLAGGVDAVVTLTSDYIGEHAQRFQTTVNLYRDRGEEGIDGVSYAIVNNEDATGAAAAIDTTNYVDAFLWYVAPFQGTVWLDSLDAWISDRWATANNYAEAIYALSGSQADAVAFGDALNTQYVWPTDTANAPEFEMQSAMSLLHAVEARMQLQVSDSLRTGANTVNVPVRMNAPTENHDPEALLAAGVSPLRVDRTTVTAIRMVTTRDETDGAPDERLFDLAAVLRARHLGERMGAALAPQLGKGIAQDGQQLSPAVARESTSAAEIQGIARAVMRQASADNIVSMLADDAAASVNDVAIITEAGVAKGFTFSFDPELTQNVIEIEVLGNLR